ncbi:MAG: SMC-Scp complex subunit ScpB [Bacteroidetes bacterium]|nr:SMC-Scp complex subunit ScpB [Bacteroidota bacterium]
MELSTIIPHIEALIFASEKPLTSLEIVELINNAFAFLEERIMLDQVESCIEGIREKYQSEFYPFEVKESGGGWQFLTKKDFHKTVAQLNGDRFLKRLSTAAMETLAIIAYKSPITKGEIESIRGVNSDYSIQKLLEKELIVITGRKEHQPGKPLVYATSKSFMDYFGINSADDLPKIKEVLAEQLVQPTVVSGDDFKSQETIDEENIIEDTATIPGDENTENTYSDQVVSDEINNADANIENGDEEN